MLRSSIFSMRKVPSLCRFESTTKTDTNTSTQDERQNVKTLQKWALLREQHSLDRWTTDDEFQTIYLRNGIDFCKKLFEIDLSDFEPLYKLNSDKPIVSRPDFARETPPREDILSNAVWRNETYFIAPPIPATMVRTRDKK